MKTTTISALFALLIFSGCKKDNNNPPQNNNSNNNNNNPPSQYFSVDGSTYALSVSSNLYFTDLGDEAYYSGNSTPVNNAVFQVVYVDPDYITSMIASGGSKTFQIQPEVTVLPNPSYGKASLEVVQNLSTPGEIIWEGQSGILTISRSGNSFTFSFSNVPVARSDNASVTSVASGNYVLSF